MMFQPSNSDLSGLPTLPRLGYGNWWVKIITSGPHCIYYFGPFLDFEEASAMCPGYVQDLIDEGAQQIHTAIKRCNPVELTKFDEAEIETCSYEHLM